MINDDRKPDGERKRAWRSPTIAEIARAAGVGTATVDRVLNGRSRVREATRLKIEAAFDQLQRPEPVAGARTQRITFLSDSGVSFNATLAEAVAEAASLRPGVACSFTSVATSQVDTVKFANLIERAAESADALVIVAREDLIINRAIRNVAARKVPVICLTTDLPTSGRAACISSDQAGAGATAAYLMGQVVGARPAKILLAYSAPYRAQEERELGFRRVLRAEFTHLEVVERVNSNDDAGYVHRNVSRYIDDHGAPAGIYNVGAGNIGIGRALEESGLAGKTVFIGHELNANSRTLLETGVMHFAIGHDVRAEVDAAVDHAVALLDKKQPPAPPLSRVRIYTKYSCN